MKRREGDLLDSFSCLLVSRELHSVATKKWISLVLFWWFLSLGAVVADLDLTGY